MRRDDEAEMYQLILEQIDTFNADMMDRIDRIRAEALAEGSISAVAEIDRIRAAIIQTLSTTTTKQ